MKQQIALLSKEAGIASEKLQFENITELFVIFKSNKTTFYDIRQYI